jgi:two-component system cell cycle response regulator
MTPSLTLDPETGLPGAARLVRTLEADRRVPRALELLAPYGADGIEEPFALAEHPDEGRRCGAALREAAARHGGSAFRVGGVVYGLLLPIDVPSGVAVAAAQTALTDLSPRFRDGLVQARVDVPDEASPSRAALRLAFHRLRARAAWHPLAPGRQVRDVLLRLLAERCAPGDEVRRREVAGHAVAVGRRLGLSPTELDDLVRASELQDVGMLILQSSVLGKRSPLDAEDWAVIRHHPVVGERVVGAAPALASVATIVRSCYERYDGSGYPDGLRAEQIPLSARIIAVSVAYDAMISTRPYRPPLTPTNAMHELSRCAGTQFDPRIVALFQDTVGVPAPERRPTARVA